MSNTNVCCSLDLQTEDSGLYTCTASSESGETAWSASLTVLPTVSTTSQVHRSPDPSTFPKPPNIPRVLNASETTVSLSWEGDHEEMGLVGYTVEYWSPDLQTGWVVAAHRVPNPYMVVRELKPDSSYVFLVRAENTNGLSAASPVSALTRTLASSRAVHHSELDTARAMLNTKVVELLEAKPLSPSSVTLAWVLTAPDFVEGLYIRFRELSGGTHIYNILTVLDIDSKRYAVTNLKKYTKYEFFISPFYKSVEGQPSNSRVCQTLEDVPSAPPESVTAGVFNESAGWVRWSPPPPQHHNGYIIGYKIQVKGNGVRSLVVNATTTSVLITNLTVGNLYSAKVAAMTKEGLGPFCNGVPLITAARSPHTLGPLVPLVRQTWFVVLLATLVLLVLAGIGVMFYLRRRKNLVKELGHLSVPVVNTTHINNKESLWIDRGWRPADCDKDSSLPLAPQTADYAEVDTRNLSTFYNCRKSPENPTPYATTMLLPPPSWSELIPPPPDHPPPNCPRETMIPNPPPRGTGSCCSGSYACYAPQMSVHGVSQCGRAQHYPQPQRAQSCSNCDAHCSLTSGSSGGRRSTPRGRPLLSHNSCDNDPRDRWRREQHWEDGDADVETDRHSCSSSHDTCCSCSESSCLYAQAGPSSTVAPSNHNQYRHCVK